MRTVFGLFVVLMLAAAGEAHATYPDWAALEAVEVVEVVTRDDDGSLRETKVWFVLVDGAPYLRTSRSAWLENLRRDPDLQLRIEGSLYEAHAKEIDGDAIVERVDAASAEKYGWEEWFVHLFRLRKPDILALSPVPDEELVPDPGATP